MTTDSAIIHDSLAEPGRFAEVYDRHARTLYRYLAARLGVDAAHDVLSESFMVAFEVRHRFDLTYDDARPWLFGIANRLVRKHRRLEAQHLRSSIAAEGSHLPDHTPIDELEQRLDASTAMTRLRAAVNRMPATDRDVLLLYAWADLDYAAIARAIGIPIGTVRSRLNRARRILRAYEEGVS